VILYEVRIAVDRELADEYHGWLEAHIREILALPGFQFAELLREEGDAARAVFVVHYWLADRDALTRYLRDHAPRMRADGAARFGDRFSAERRVLELDRRIGQR
jgi:heme-degrading monooxygenase HmoA